MSPLLLLRNKSLKNFQEKEHRIHPVLKDIKVSKEVIYIVPLES